MKFRFSMAVLIIVLSDPGFAEKRPPAPEWTDWCSHTHETLKHLDFDNRQLVNPSVPASLDSSLINFDGLYIPSPSVPVRRSAFRQEDEGFLALSLWGDQGLLMLIRRMNEDEYPTVTGIHEDMPTILRDFMARSFGEHGAITKRLFGENVSGFDLALQSFELNLEDIDCNGGLEEALSKLIVAVSFPALSIGDPPTVYISDGNTEGFSVFHDRSSVCSPDYFFWQHVLRLEGSIFEIHVCGDDRSFIPLIFDQARLKSEFRNQ